MERTTARSAFPIDSGGRTLRNTIEPPLLLSIAVAAANRLARIAWRC